MSKKHLKRGPVNLRKNDERHIWIYEENGGLNVYTRVSSADVGPINFTIPVGTIRAYLKRKDKEKT